MRAALASQSPDALYLVAHCESVGGARDTIPKRGSDFSRKLPVLPVWPDRDSASSRPSHEMSGFHFRRKRPRL